MVCPTWWLALEKNQSNMNSFTAIDFETAHSESFSICQVGLVRVEHGVITDELNLLVQPPGNYYWHRFIQIHGITPEQTAHAPTFDEIWHLVLPFIQNQTVVAHNGFRFDFRVLENTLAYYGLKVPEYEKQCTLRIYKKNLASLCENYKISLNHHDALSDAKACAALYLRYLQKSKE